MVGIDLGGISIGRGSRGPLVFGSAGRRKPWAAGCQAAGDALIVIMRDNRHVFMFEVSLRRAVCFFGR